MRRRVADEVQTVAHPTRLSGLGRHAAEDPASHVDQARDARTAPSQHEPAGRCGQAATDHQPIPRHLENLLHAGADDLAQQFDGHAPNPVLSRDLIDGFGHGLAAELGIPVIQFQPLALTDRRGQARGDIARYG